MTPTDRPEDAHEPVSAGHGVSGRPLDLVAFHEDLAAEDRAGRRADCADAGHHLDAVLESDEHARCVHCGACPLTPEDLAAAGITARPEVPPHLAAGMAAWQALQPAVAATVESMRRMALGLAPAVQVLDPDPAPCRASDPQAYALWAVRNRNTGPAHGRPTGHRRRPR